MGMGMFRGSNLINFISPAPPFPSSSRCYPSCGGCAIGSTGADGQRRSAIAGASDLRAGARRHPPPAGPGLLRRLSDPRPTARSADRQRRTAARGALSRARTRRVGFRRRRVHEPADAVLARLLRPRRCTSPRGPGSRSRSPRCSASPTRCVQLALWALYLSFVQIGQLFYGYGWETQLLETGFLAVFLCPLTQPATVPRSATADGGDLALSLVDHAHHARRRRRSNCAAISAGAISPASSTTTRRSRFPTR